MIEITPPSPAIWTEDAAYRIANPEAGTCDDQGYPAALYFYRSTEQGARDTARILGANQIELSTRYALGPT